MPATKAACPVCLRPVPDRADDSPEDVNCQQCGWTLFTGYRLGPVTAELERVFDNRLRAAVQKRDLDAASAAARGLDADDLARSTAREAARALAAAGQGAGPLVVTEVGVAGITARTFGADGRWERAWLESWSWNQIIDDLPDEPEARRFWLAGGSGQRLPSHAGVAELARSFATSHAATWPALAVLLGPRDWAVPDLFAAELSRGHGAPVPGELPSTPPAARRIPAGVIAGAIAQQAARSGSGDAEISAVAAVPDRDGQIRLLTIPDTAGSASIRLLTATTTALALSPGAEAVAAGGRDGEVRLCSLRSNVSRVRVAAHGGRVAAVRFGRGVVLSLGSDGWLHSVPVTGTAVDVAGKASFDLGRSGCSTLACATSAPVAVAGGIDGVVRLVDLGAGNRMDLPGLHQSVTSVAIDSAGGIVAAGLSDGSVRLLDLERRWFARLDLAGSPGGTIGPIDLQANGGLIALVACDASGGIYYCSGLVDGEIRVDELGRHEGGVRAVILLDTCVVSAGREDGVLRLWSRPGAGGSMSLGGAR